jgi:hypothetical protein
VAFHRGEVTRLRKQTNVEAVTGERLHERRAGAVPYRGESQS